MTQTIAGLREIAQRYDHFLLDQYGVLHDGRAVFPGVLDCLGRLRDRGKSIAMISNSGKRAAANRARLERLGFARDLFDIVVTSGEVCHRLLQDRLASGALARGARCLVISRDDDRSPLEGLAIAVTQDPEQADFVLISGIEPERVALGDYIARLIPLAARGLPCLCANPDLRMYADGQVSPGAGALAQAYAEQGGEVTWIGKPHPEIFKFALSQIGCGKASRAVMVGDSPEHDVAGAKASGMAAVFVTGGLYGGHEVRGKRAFSPDYVTERLAW